jgi:hypothetical protein
MLTARKTKDYDQNDEAFYIYNEQNQEPNMTIACKTLMEGYSC